MKWIRSHKWLIFFIVVVLFCSAAGSLYFLKSDKAAHAEIPIKMKGSKVVVKEKNGTEKELVNPFGDSKKPNEETVQEYIHGMSHQKVKANEKWTLYKITDERINYLIEVVKAYPFSHKQLYLDILNRWKKGDFTHVVQDHNAIWRLEGGNIGKALRRLTPEQEKAELVSKNYK